ncbi:hypothetical protein PR001_g24290 [Phytophthora rubi]|nr:hypothetical protein PR001_g24290 [Phytophthora rubi]
MAAALALLLDFMKAYDSVDRDFLYDALTWLGFPLDYISAMRGLHGGTRVRFLANGYRSRWVEVTCGIRQGCPLTPLLFLLVLEALYRRIDTEQRVQGIILKSKAGDVRLKVGGGYADDTASYVRSVVEVAIIIALTSTFALASGLHLNAKKTLVIALNPAAVATTTGLPAPLAVQEVTKLSRYLGIPVGSIPDEEYTWQLTRTQLATRLALATRKTMTPDQRSLVAMAVVVPKILFVGRHIWPSRKTMETFQRLIKNFVWHATFTDATGAGRAWLNDHISGLPRQQGGLAIPDLKAELLALAAVTVTVNKWALTADHPALGVGDVITAAVSATETAIANISPRHTAAPMHGKRFRASLWTTGFHLCTSYGGRFSIPAKPTWR